MKKAILFAAVAILALTACKKDDNNSVDVSQLEGIWSTFDDESGISRTYSFDGKGGYRLIVHDVSNTSVTHTGTYETLIGDNTAFIFLTEEDNKEVYFIHKLNRGEMVWQEAVLGTLSPERKFVRMLIN